MNQTKVLSDALKLLNIEGSETILNSSHVNLNGEHMGDPCLTRYLPISKCNVWTISKFKDLKVKTKDGKELKCFIPAATYIGKISAHDGFSGKTKEEQAAVYQWLEYCLLQSSNKVQMLSDLNSFLKDKVYFVGNRYTIVDLVLYLCLHEVYYKMSFQEKESYCNLSRWLRLVQNEVSASDLYPRIYFSKTHLYT